MSFSISFPDLINFLTLWIAPSTPSPPHKKGLGWKEAQWQGDFTNNFSIYTYTLQNFTQAVCKCKKYTYTATG